MEADSEDQAPLDSSFFEGRLLVEIEAWNCALSVRLSSEAMPREYRFQGGLDVTRGFQIDGRIRAPGKYRGERISIYLLPFGPQLEEWEEVGRLYLRPAHTPDGPRLSANLLIPEATLPLVATCLSSVWRYVHIWTFDEDAVEASISAFGFDNEIHQNLLAWVEDR